MEMNLPLTKDCKQTDALRSIRNCSRATWVRNWLWTPLAAAFRTSVLLASNSAIWPALRNTLVLPICWSENMLQMLKGLNEQTLTYKYFPDTKQNQSKRISTLLTSCKQGVSSESPLYAAEYLWNYLKGKRNLKQMEHRTHTCLIMSQFLNLNSY